MPTKAVSYSYDEIIVAQNAIREMRVESAIPVRLASDQTFSAPIVMPNLVGLSLRDATFWLTKLGVKVEVKGHGMVESQWPEPETVLPAIATLSLK
jgi:beta-lactam-binding protein with PASTA domain